MNRSKQGGMGRKAVVALLVGLAVALVDLAEAQQAAKVPSIGYLTLGSSSPTSSNLDGFRQGLRELGYVEGQNIHVEYRYAEGRVERLPGLAAELIALKVAVIVAANTQSIEAVRRATKTIPIVFPATFDPVESRFITSLAHPGWKSHGFDHT
jgi:putative ABC transport system substrate-binding protein